MDTFTTEGALLIDTFGMDLLEYLTATEREGLLPRLSGKVALSPTQEQVVSELLGLATQATVATSGTNHAPVVFRLDALGRFDVISGTSVGNALRLHAGGQVALPVPGDPVTGGLTLLLRDLFPLTLLPATGRYPEDPLPLVGPSIWSSPHRIPFEEAVLRDADLSRLFVVQDEHGAWYGYTKRSTGSGGTVSLRTLANQLLTNAWWRARLSSTYDLAAIHAELLIVLDVLRRATRGETCKVPVLVAFTGMVFDDVAEIHLPFGTLRPIADHERNLAPSSIEGGMSRTTAEGDTVTATYAGDVLLETTMQYRLKISDPTKETRPSLADLKELDRLATHIDTIRLGTLLAGKGDATLALTPTWRMVFDPLTWGPMQGQRDPRRGILPRPHRMTPAVANDFEILAAAIHRHRNPNFDVAVRRTISGMTTRIDQVDALIDLVIAWENLFGSNQGELRLRISAAIAWLLGPTAKERRRYRDEVVKIYDLRSAIVHGGPSQPLHVRDSLGAARRITLDVFRRLFIDRPDILAMKTGNVRSTELIVGSDQQQESEIRVPS